MKISSKVLVCGALLLVAASALEAQSAPASGGGAAPAATPAPAVTAAPAVTDAPAVTPKDIGPLEAWPDKPLGKYDIVINIPEGSMPVEITISEASKGLSALFYKVGDLDAHIMDATVNGTDLVLKGNTPRGALTIKIRHHGAKLSGVWQLGEDQGTVEGSTKS